MKYLMPLTAALFFSGAVANANMSCTQQRTACDSQGDTYRCNDVAVMCSTPVRVSEEASAVIDHGPGSEACGACYGQYIPSPYCAKECDCSGPFCGSW